MGIWEYAVIEGQAKKVATLGDGPSKTCAFCSQEMERLSHVFTDGWQERDVVYANFCTVCGWWEAQRMYRYQSKPSYICDSHAKYSSIMSSSLKELDVSDLRTPIEEVRSFLSARYQQRKLVHPRLFEETVASVFSDLGYSTHVTGFSNDGGIDIILANGEDTIGVQVKRYKNRIEVDQIRSLAGALVLHGLTKGIFVTTSSFQSGARQTTEGFRQRGIAIELEDGQRFLESLHIAQRNRYESLQELPFELQTMGQGLEWTHQETLNLGLF